MDEHAAEVIALQALEWVLGNDELRSVFMGSTGLGADELPNSALDPQTWVAVMDFISMDDAWVLEFCEHAKLAPEKFLGVKMALPGQGVPNWT